MTETKYTHFLKWLFVGLVLILFVIAWGPCDPRNYSNNSSSSIGQQVAAQRIVRDSIIVRVDTVTRLVTKVVTKYRTIRYDSLIPCETKLQVCDTVVITQDSLIRELRTLVKADSVLIEYQDLTIIDLTKSVKREKRKRRIAVVIAAIFAGIIAVK